MIETDPPRCYAYFMNDAERFGEIVASVLYGVSPARLGEIKRAHEVRAASANPADLRLLLKMAHAVLQVTNAGDSAPAHHLRILHETPGWSKHASEVAGLVASTIMMLKPVEEEQFRKTAFSDLMSAGGQAGKMLGYGSLGAGAGLGALYWLLSRHATQDEADIEGMTRQVDYYDELGRNLQESMRRNYRYDKEQNAVTS